ncbi:MAG: alpha/beta hydrolase [Candidatus Aminicenantaceae bacterium]
MPSYFPYHSLVLGRYIRQNLSKIKIPILIIQSRYDNKVNPKGAEHLFQNIGSKTKRLIYAENSGHVVLLDFDREKVFKEITSFIENL